MNLSQFKSWFEGFTENLSGVPNKRQWARIQERVAEISPDPMPPTVFIDRYVRPYRPWWQDQFWCSGTTSKTLSQNAEANVALQSGTNEPAMFYNAGTLEAQEVASNT